MNMHTTTGIITERALLVSLSISQWSGRRLDRAVTNEINRDHGAVDNAGRYNKLLLPPEALEKITKIVSDTRQDFMKRTLPWMNDGSRIMAAAGYLDHINWLRGQEAKFTSAVQDFIARYPSYVSTRATELGSMFNHGDYPEPAELASRFAMTVQTMPVPSANDFRVDMSRDMADRIRTEITTSVNAAIQTAVTDVYRRVHEVTSRMVDRLNNYKPATGRAKAEGIFRDSLVENIRDLISIMPTLNITCDPRIDALANELKAIVQYDASVLRENAGVRADTAHEAQRILDTISDYLA